MTVKTGDNVLVITGKDKGKTGKVTAVYADQGKVLVENVNIVSKHQKPKSQQDKGGIFKRPAPIDASNVQVVCSVCGKATRVAHAEIDGKKVRVCKKCNASLDKEFVKQTKKEAKKTIKAADLKNTKLKAAEKAEPAVKEEKTAAKKTTKSASTKTAATKVAATKTAEKAPKTEKTAEKTTKSVEKTTKTTKKAAETKAEPKTTKKSTTAKKEAK